VSGLKEVARRNERLIDTVPARAVRLSETFLTGCYEKADEVDDLGGRSSG
jgi:hypothetical protein